ncbi:MAG: DUF1287 domain-containing protein [Desulfitobacteriaceae bacterium]|nr:DUF1287 domain-containing protein [Desulfitobacteriaceae bacterium]MDD4346949.1 DUF1287 domain-containing protein [Desulfitobacteriaceae bacterium]MDD4402211.1 DUF1287 domain-containing protein [Desulfitobacteriaceae bacterium]
MKSRIKTKKFIKHITVLFGLAILALAVWKGSGWLSSACHSLTGSVADRISNISCRMEDEDGLNTPVANIPGIACPTDKDNDGIDDLKDIVAGARAEVMRKPQYRSVYYQGGYPPATEGVCTDLVWRAMRDAGYDLKALVDKDIRENSSRYYWIGGKPDPNIDFRRVQNLVVFFRNNGKELTREIISADIDNLSQWQAGDIVTYDYPHEHIAIVSNKRNNNGVPFIFHNAGPIASETDQLQSWPSKITGHFRFPRF